MEFKEIFIKGAFLLKPKIFGDSRGYFFESFNKKEFEENIGAVNFVQDNESESSVGVLRGLHFQKGKYAQAKLVRVIKGAVLDVIVDIRPDSPTFGKHFSIELTEKNKLQLFLPRGMAHGFVVMENNTVFAYKVDNVYSPENESGILYNDPDLSINWQLPESSLILSDKDKKLSTLKEKIIKIQS
ncbi:MAG: dTDP-4-dehydrorhamnose 3,5-epimerase [Prevotellaceae bacterium]|jgi:dTDP-4-dehydrorhamnose 3,5-epimerase|nr:dTDP-4-dehydrorhamnose 3,5-epimerase [Prevotellaceae bacterium]